MAVAAVSSRVSEGVLNIIMDDERLLRKYTDYWKSLLQEVCFGEHVSQFSWARLAARLGGETTAGMLRSDAVRVPHVRSGLMVMRFFGDVKKMPWALCLCNIDSSLICLGALEGEISKIIAWKIRRLLQAGLKSIHLSVG